MTSSSREPRMTAPTGWPRFIHPRVFGGGEVSALGNFDPDRIPSDLHAVAANSLGGMIHCIARPQIELPRVAGAGEDGALHGSLVQGNAPMGTGILDRVECSAVIKKGDVANPHPKYLGTTWWDLLDVGTSNESGHGRAGGLTLSWLCSRLCNRLPA